MYEDHGRKQSRDTQSRKKVLHLYEHQKTLPPIKHQKQYLVPILNPMYEFSGSCYLCGHSRTKFYTREESLIWLIHCLSY
jgi:hypothetical protein